MPGKFGTAGTVEGPAHAAYVVTPGASPLPEPIRAVTINVSGAITFTSSIDNRDYTTNTLPVGSHPLFATHILAATTADGITGWV